jgi:hypothetical protein
MADARQLRLDSERAFRLARAGCRKFFDELNDLGWDLQLQAQKVAREAQESEIKSWKDDSDLHFPEDSCTIRIKSWTGL